MKNNRWRRWVLCILAYCAAPATTPQAEDRLGSIADFMIMDVCIAADGHVLRDIRPGDQRCVSHRNIEPNEVPPYYLSNFPAPGSSCPAGSVLKDNTPVLRDGVTRIISSSIRKGGSSCRQNIANQTDGASVQWYDNAYGFIMGSYSPVAFSLIETPACRNRKTWSERFFRGWVIAPVEVPEIGGSGIGVFESKLSRGNASDLPAECPEHFRSALTSWTVDRYQYKSGLQFVSIISSHYAQVSSDGLSQGDALQMEQTYWTRELGLSRWEKWAREDWVNPRNHLSAHDAAESLMRRGRCSVPFTKPVRYSAEMEVVGDAEQNGLATKVIKNPATGDQHTWYMTLCEDYTNLQPNSGNGLQRDRSVLADQSFWK